jgi:hypothetical protein
MNPVFLEDIRSGFNITPPLDPSKKMVTKNIDHFEENLADMLAPSSCCIDFFYISKQNTKNGCKRERRRSDDDAFIYGWDEKRTGFE